MLHSREVLRNASEIPFFPDQQRQYLDQLHTSVTQTYTKIGLADYLHTTFPEYALSLPRIPLQPPEFAGQFDIPLIVDPRIPTHKLVDLIGITDVGGLSVEKPQKELPFEQHGPYVTWVSLADSGGEQSREQRGATLREGLYFLLLMKSGTNLTFHLPGTVLKGERVPYIASMGNKYRRIGAFNTSAWKSSPHLIAGVTHT